jgi:hypothetical protein
VINLLQLQGRSLPLKTVPEAFNRFISDIKYVYRDRGDTTRWERSLRTLGPDGVDKQYWTNIISQSPDQQTHDLFENDLRTLLQSQGRSLQ